MKQLKYHLKAMVLARRPGWYWGARRLLRGPFEPEIELLRTFPSSSGAFVDVGASLGAYSHAALTRGFVVHAFEPQHRVASVLERGLAGAFVHGVALSDRWGEAELRVPRNDVGYATIGQRNELRSTADVRLGVSCGLAATVRLDDLDVGFVSLIKIDVEGHEQAVLRGARQMLERDRPMLIIEVEERHCRGSRAMVCRFLEELGYSTFLYFRGRLERRATREGLSELARNLVFVHRSREQEFEQGMMARPATA
jgi:FkbM family methyltransferase